MRPKFLITILFSYTLSSIVYAGDRTTCDHHAKGEDIYRHYTGTIGSRKVMVDLRYGFCGASNYGGTMVYDMTSGSVHRLTIREPESFAHDAELTGTETDIQQNWIEEVDKSGLPAWKFVIGDHKVIGKYTAEGKEADIQLAEDYANASEFNVSVFEDSMKTMKPGKPMANGYYSYIGIVPGSNMPQADSRFFTEHAGNNIASASLSQQALNNFKTSYEMLASDTTSTGWKSIKRVYCSNTVMPMYNNNGIVVLELNTFGIENGSYRAINTHQNLDIKGRKEWTTVNIIDGKTGQQKLLNLLKEADSKRNIKTSKETITGEVSLPHDVAITNSGLLFFTPGITSLDPGICTYLPYSKLKGILSPAFAKRMGL